MIKKAFMVIGAIVGAIIGIVLFSLVFNFIPATIIYGILLILGIHTWSYFQIFFGTYLLVFIANLILGGISIDKK